MAPTESSDLYQKFLSFRANFYQWAEGLDSISSKSVGSNGRKPVVIFTDQQKEEVEKMLAQWNWYTDQLEAMEADVSLRSIAPPPPPIMDASSVSITVNPAFASRKYEKAKLVKMYNQQLALLDAMNAKQASKARTAEIERLSSELELLKADGESAYRVRMESGIQVTVRANSQKSTQRTVLTSTKKGVFVYNDGSLRVIRPTSGLRLSRSDDLDKAGIERLNLTIFDTPPEKVWVYRESEVRAASNPGRVS